MLDMALGSIRFPNLRHYVESTLIRPKWDGNPDPSKSKKVGEIRTPVHLYKLDWESFEQSKKDKFWEWVKKYHPRNERLAWVEPLPEKYMEVLDDLVFCLRKDYLSEIRYCTQMAFMEWSKQRHFDTSIREMCLEPAQAYVRVAFKLICDCPFDEERHYYKEHDWIRRIAVHAMLYRFWHGQTGRGLLWRNAEMEQLNPENWPTVWKSMDPEVIKFYQDMKSHDEDQIERLAVSVEGPKVGPDKT